MATTITSVNIGSTQDRRMTLSNSQIARLMSIGNDFVRLRIGCRLCVGDSGADITGTPAIWLGLLSNPTANMSNGPLGSSTSHFVGCQTALATWTRATSPIIKYDAGSSSSIPSIIKRVGSTNTTASLANAFIRQLSAAPTTIRPGCFIDILKGSPNFSISTMLIVGTTGLGTGDVSLGQLMNAMEISSLASAAASLTAATGVTYTTSGPTTIAVDEATNGPLNAICAAWNRSSVPVYLSELLYCTFPS